MELDSEVLRKAILTLALSTVGGLIFTVIGAPAPLLTGPGVVVGTAALMGLPIGLPTWLKNAAFLVLGTTMGTAVTPEAIATIWRWPLGVVGLVISLTLIMGGIAFYLERVHGFDRMTARLAGIPGNMTLVLALIDETGADRHRVLIIQVFRLVMMVIVAPIVLSLTGLAKVAGRPRLPWPTASIGQLLLLLGLAVGGALAFKRFKFPAPQMFGPMLVGGLLTGSGVMTVSMPQPLLSACFLVTGSIVGTHLVGIDRKLLRETFVAALGSVAIGGGVALACAAPVGWMLHLPVVQLFLAYAPGGVDMMAILALALGLDAAFVGVHHAARFFCLGIIVSLFVKSPAANGNGDNGEH